MENLWLTSAKRLQAIAGTGLHFSNDDYHRERFEEVAELANGMLAELGNVPIERIENLVSDFAKGYATPKIDVRGALIDEDKVLLVKESADGLWALPGGFAEVGYSASENIVKEIKEEAGLTVVPKLLYSVRHKAKRSYEPDARDFYKLFFLCQRVDNKQATAGIETLEAEYFSRDNLPPLSLGRCLETDIEAAFEFANGNQRVSTFD